MKIFRFLPRPKRLPTKKDILISDVNLKRSNTFLDLRKEVTRVRENVPIIEIHFDEILPFFHQHRKIVSMFLVVLLVVSSFGFFFRSRASVAHFYPDTCLGPWLHPENAQGVPALDKDTPLEEFNSGNSAALGNSSAQLYCGTFKGEIPKDALPKSFILDFIWSVDNGSVVHTQPERYDGPFGSREPNTSGIDESQNSGIPINGNADNVSATEEEPALEVPPAPIPEPDAPSIDVSPESPQSFLDTLAPYKARAQETPAETPLEVVEEISPVENTSATEESSIEETPTTVSEPTPEIIVETDEPVFSNAVEEQAPDAFASIAYTLDGATWNSLGVVGKDTWRQAQFEIPLRAWDDLSKLQVSVTPIQTLDKPPVVYIDAIRINVDYEEGSLHQKPIVRINDESADVLDGDTDFASDESPTFAVVDPKLSTEDIAALVKDEKATVVEDRDNVLSPKQEESKPSTEEQSGGFFESLKETFTPDPLPDIQREPAPPIEPKDEGVLEAPSDAAPPVEVEVIEGAPPVTEEEMSTEEASEPAPQPQTAPEPAPISEAVVAFLPSRESLVKGFATRALSHERQRNPVVSNLFAPRVAHADSIFDNEPLITKAIVLDYHGNPTTIKTSIQTVTIDGESRSGVTVEKPKRSMRAGRYTLEVTVETDEAVIITQQDFTWGVLAINADKSIYQKDNTAFLQMGVLDDRGNTLCDAFVELSVKSPSGSVSKFSTEDETIEQSKLCARNNVVEVADYFAHYEIPGEAGRYVMTLTAHTENGTRTIRDTFDVGDPDFDVSRTAPTRIFPFSKYDYPMTMRITPKYDWSGTIVETIPSGFVISQPKKSQKYESITETADLITVTWKVDMKAGEETVIGYLFKGPEVSPEFFLLGPLEFYNAGDDSTSATPIFKETRMWQIADDASCSTPGGSTTATWTAVAWSCGTVPQAGDTVTITAGDVITMNANSAALSTITVNGTLYTSDGTSRNLTGTTISIGSAGLLAAKTSGGTPATSTITLSGTTGTLLSVTAGGSFDEGESEVVVTSSSGAQTLLSAAETFHRLTINGTATVINAGAAITMSSANSANRLYIQDGVLNDGGNQITGTANGTLVIDGSAALCIGGTAAATNATCNSGTTPTSATTFPTLYTNANITINAASNSGWYNTAWGYRTKITIDESKVGASDSTDFPVLVSLTQARWKTVANGGNMGNAGATDLLFTSSDGTTKLKHEIEYYDATTGQIIAWVKVPTLSSSVNTELYMYYGNAGVAAQADVANVWTNGFKTVMHVGDGTTLSAADSTGTYNGTVSGTTATTGQVDGAMAVTCGNEITSPAGLYTMVGGGNTYSLSMWVYQTSTGSTRYLWDGDSANGLSAFMNIASGVNLEWGNRDIASEGVLYRTYTGLTLNATTWYHIVAQKTAAGDNGNLYIDGALKSTYTGTIGGLSNSSSGMYWGNYHNSGTSCLDGKMDEMRISSTVRSADWVLAEYNNQSSPSTFIPTVNAEELVGVDATVYYNANANTTISSAPTYRNLVLAPPITGTTTYTFASGATTINGNFTINPSSAGSNALTVNMGDDITVASTKTTSITKTSNASSTLATVSNGNDLSSGTISICSSCTLTAASTNSTITLTGTTGTLLTNTGTFTEGSSTVAVTSATGPVALVSAAETFHILTINSASSSTVVNAGAAVTIADNSGSALTVSSGVFNDSGFGIATSGSTNNTLTLGSGGTLCLGGASGANTSATCDTSATSASARAMPSFSAYAGGGSGIFHATSTVIYLSNAATTISNSQTYGNLKFMPVMTSAGVTYTLGGAMTINGDWTINPNDGGGSRQLLVNAAGTMTVASGKTTTITRQGSTATSLLDLRPSSTDYNLSTGLLVVATGGTLDATSAASTITLTGTSGTLFTRTGTFTITSGTPTVTLSGNGAATINSGTLTLYNLTQTGTGTKTVGSSSAITITHDLTVSAGEFAPNLQTVTGSGTNVISVASGATLYVDASTWAGNYSSFETRTISAGSTVDYKLAGTQTVDSTLTYSNLVISGASGTKSPDGNITATLTFVQSGGNTYDLLPGSTDYNLTTGNLTIGTGCTLDGTSSSAVITLTGTSGTLFTKTGTYTQGTTTVLVTSASGSPTLLSAGTTFHRLTINAAANVINAGAAITMSSASAANRLYIQKGVLNDGGNQIAGTANGTLLIGGNGALCIGGTAAGTNATCDSGATPNSATTFPTNYTSGNITIYSSATAASWYNSSWGYRTKITIDYTKVSTTNHTDFPVLINSTNADWKHTGSGGHVGNSDGTDILFTSSDGTTKLKHEIERYTSTTGEVIAWVKVPTLSSSANTELYMYYGNAGVAAQADAANVWDSNFKTVLHLGDGSTLSAASSTGINNGTITGPMSALAGKIGGAGCAHGTTQCSGTAANTAGLTFTTFSSTTPTVSMWVKLDNATVPQYQNVGALSQSNGLWLNNGKLDLYTTSDHNANTSVGTGAWVHVAMTYDGTTIRYYYNGATDGTGSVSAFNYQINGLYKDNGFTNETLRGSIDEYRFSNAVRSAGWIATEYNTMNSPSTFYALGMEDVYNAAAGIVYYNADAATTVSVTPTYADLRFRPVLTADRTYTLAGALPINGDLSINPSGSANTLLVNAGGHITASNGTISITRQGSNALSSLDIRPGGSDYNLSSKYLTIATGATLDATGAASSIAVTGTTGTLITFGGTFNVGTTTTTISGNGTATLNSGAGSFYNLVLNATGTKTLGGNITIDPAATLTITTGTLDTSSASNYVISAGHIDIANSASAILTLNASAVGLTGTSGTLITRGSSGVFGGSGSTSVVTISGNGTATVNSGTLSGSTNRFYDLVSSGTGTKTLGAAIDVGNTFGVTGGTFALSSHNISVAGVTIGASGTIDGGSATITNSSGWSNSGTFTSGTSTVLFNTASTITISGTTSFNNLTITHTAAKQVNFAASGGTPTYTVTGVFTVTGNVGALIKLWSASSGTKWDFLPSGTASVNYVDIKDGGCHSGAISIGPTNATDSGNNDSCWGFSTTPTLTFDLDTYATAVTSTETGAPYSVALGTLTTANASNSDEASINAIWFDLDTNASGGAIVTVTSLYGELRSTSVPADDIPSSTGTMAPGVANYGLCAKRNGVTSGTFNKVSPFNGATCTTGHVNDVGAVTTSAQIIYNTGGAAVTGARAEIMVNAENSAITPAHNDYTDTLTFIATGTF